MGKSRIGPKGEHGVTNNYRREAVEALEAFQAANVELRHRLRHTEVRVQRMLCQVERGDGLVAVLYREGLGGIRSDLVDELARFERTRHHMRLACFRLGLMEGATSAELARAWGFSRQLAARFSKEAAAARHTPADSLR